MMLEGRSASYLGLSAILLLLALGGWGAFAYILYAGRQEVQFLRQEVGRLTTERQQFTSNLQQMAEEIARMREERDRSRQALERLQADLIEARAEAAASKALPRPVQQPSSPPLTSPPNRRRNQAL